MNSSRIQGHFFFVDIVGLSNPSNGSTETQIEKIKVLHKAVSECQAYRAISVENKYTNLTGDGMVIGFLEGPELPLELAIQLHNRLKRYNRGKTPIDNVKVRIGIDSAPVMFYTDILGERNVWGEGIILAKRVMDLGDAGHILLTERIAKGLKQFQSYRDVLHKIGKYNIKHGESIDVWSAYNDEFGNGAEPKNQNDSTSRDNDPLKGKIEVFGESVKFVSSNSFELSVGEAIAVILYALDRPLLPSVIYKILAIGWKKVSNVSQYLAVPLRRYVIKADKGYILTEEGKRWVGTQVLAKL